MSGNVFKITWKMKIMLPMNTNTFETFVFSETPEEALRMIEHIALKDILLVEEMPMEGALVTKQHSGTDKGYYEY